MLAPAHKDFALLFQGCQQLLMNPAEGPLDMIAHDIA
jgi:hypothetical protein